MGLAMAVKQTPWLIVPFVVGGIVLESRRLRDWKQGFRDGLRYLGIAGLALLIPNLPYLLNSPRAWLNGILTPITAPTVPAGQGLISLSLSLPLGGGSLSGYTAAALVVLVTLVACYLTTYPALKPAAFLLPSIVLFFATRSFGSYLVMLIPAGVAAAATTQRPQFPEPWRLWKWVVSGAVASCVLAILGPLNSPSPLRMSIESVRTTGQLATVDQMTVSVANNSSHDVRPSFTVDEGLTMTAFWRRVHGPPVLGSHQQARYTIQAPSYFAAPSINNGFQVLAFSDSPATVSRTGSYVPSLWRVVLQPSAINLPVARKQTFKVRAEIVNRNNDPVYFEANLVKNNSAYPYGYSPILAVRFRK